MNNVVQLPPAQSDGFDAMSGHGLEPLPVSEAIARASQILSADVNIGHQPYPIDSLGVLAPVANAIAEGVQIAPATAGQTVLAVAALLTQGHFNVASLQGIKPLSLPLLTIVPSGDGKDTADGLALKAVHDWQRQLIAEHKKAVESHAEAEANHKRGEPKPEEPGAPKFLIVKDATVEGLRVSFDGGSPSQGIFSTEAGSVLMGYGFSNEQKAKTSAALNGLFDNGHLSVARSTTGRFERYGLRLSAHLMIQPVAVGEAINDELLQNIGFWPRWIIAWPEPLEPRKYRPWVADNSPAYRDYLARCRELLAKPPYEDVSEADVLPLSSGAKKALAAFWESMERASRKGELSTIKPFATRATEMACRIAGVLTAWEGGQAVSESAATCAIDLMAYSLHTWKAIIDGGRGDPTTAWALTLYKWLAKRGGFVSIKDMTKLAPPSTRSAYKRDAALSLLSAHGLVYEDGGDVIAVGVAPR